MNKRVLCVFCNKPIHIDEFGGVMSKDYKPVFFHIKCKDKIKKT
jgi:hypothetical protein